MGYGWDYPAGVTGNEAAIAGASWDGEVEVSCQGTNVTILAQLATGGTGEVYLDACPYEGPVEVACFGGVASYTCPMCRTLVEMPEGEL